MTTFLITVLLMLPSLGAPTPTPPVTTATTITTAAAAQSDIEGEWLFPRGDIKIRMARNGDIYQGKVIWLKPGEETKDIHNENPSLRSRDILGLTIIDGYRYDANSKKFTGGTMYLPPRGKTAKAELAVEGNQLKVTVKIGFLSKTIVATRA